MGNLFAGTRLSNSNCQQCECRWVRDRECALIRRGADQPAPQRVRRRDTPNFSQWLQQAAQQERQRRGSRSRSASSRTAPVPSSPKRRQRSRQTTPAVAALRPVDVQTIKGTKWKSVKTPEAPTECPLCEEPTRTFTRCPFCKRMWCAACDKKLYQYPKARYVHQTPQQYVACPFCRRDLAIK